MKTRRRALWLLLLVLPLAAWLAAALLGRSAPERPGSTATARRPTESPQTLATRPLPQPTGALTLRGRVLDSNGAPVAEAAVFATQPPEELDLVGFPSGCRDAQSLLEATCPEAQRRIVERVTNHGAESPALARALSLPDGSFVLTGLSDGAYTLWAERAGVGIAYRQQIAAGAQDVSLSLEKGRVLTGRVVGDHGEPFPGAAVTAIGGRAGRFFDGESDQDGRFVIGPVPDDESYRLVATAEGRLADNAQDFEREPLLLHLVTPVRLSGRVVKGDRPVPGATVQEGAVTATTDEEGRFALEDLRPGEHRLNVSTTQDFATEMVELAPVKGNDDVEIRLVAGVLLSGSIHDPQGHPIAGATVSAQERSARTDAEGRYHLPAFAAGESVFIQIDAAGYCHRDDNRTFPEGEQTVDYKLSPCVSLSGRVVDAQGRPVADAAVVADAEQQYRSNTVRSDKEGRFEVDGLTEGVEYTVEAMKDRKDISARMQIRPPAENLRLELLSGRSIRGQVVDAHGEPARFAAVSVREKNGIRFERSELTDAEGRFTVAGLPDGPLHVEASLQVHPSGSAEAEVEAGRTDVESLLLQLPEPELYTVTGVVVTPTGQPVPQAAVRLGIPGNTLASAMSQEEGRFELQVDTPGEYSLSARDSSFENECSDLKVRVPSAGPITVVLHPKPWVYGKVLRANGRPVTNFSIDGQIYRDAQGAFRLPEPSAQVNYFFSAVALASKWVTLEPGAMRGPPLQVVLEEGHTVTGRLVDAESGAPLPSIAVEIDPGRHPSTDLASEGESTVTGPSGEFTLPHVAEAIELRVSSVMGYSEGTWTVTPDMSTVTLRLSPSHNAENR